MGNEFVSCCSQTLSVSEQDTEHRETALADKAKHIHEINELKANKYNEQQHRYSSSELPPQQKEKVKKLDVNKSKNKRIRKGKRTFSVDSKLSFTEIELKQTQNEIEILRKQNKMLQKQNEQFISQYHCNLESLHRSNITSSSSTNSMRSIHSLHSMHSTHSRHSINSINSLTTDLSQLSKISYSNEYKQDAMSPFSPLTDEQTHIILSYSNSNSSNDICIDIGSCNTIKRIINALKWYSLCGGDQGVLLKKIVETKYDKYLLNDYQHILNGHNKEYKLIKNEMNKEIKPCDIKTCNGYKRYKALSQKINNNTFVVDILDLIHCVLIHSEYKK